MIKKIVKPASLKEASILKDKSNYYLSGGTRINWAPARAERKLQGKPAIENVILIKDLLPKDIIKQGTDLLIGAGITFQELIDNPETPGVLKKAAGFIASRNIRNMATLGGNIAANLPDSCIIPCLIALKARIRTVKIKRYGADTENAGGQDAHKVDSGKTVTGKTETVTMSVEDYITQGKNDLIKEIILPRVDGVCVIDRALKSSAAYPAVTAAVRISEKDAVVALGCVADHVIRLKEIESAILDNSLSGDSLAGAVADIINPESDLTGSIEYKKYISGSMIVHLTALSGKGA